VATILSHNEFTKDGVMGTTQCRSVMTLTTDSYLLEVQALSLALKILKNSSGLTTNPAGHRTWAFRMPACWLWRQYTI